MQFRPEHYYQASLERMRQAREILLAGSSHALAMYCGGLAVECLLRAFRLTKDPSFDERHDLNALLTASGILRVDDQFMRRRNHAEGEILRSGRELKEAMQEVVTLWYNNLRFTSEDRLRAHLKQIGRTRGIKGDPLKKNASDMLIAAQTVINRGMVLWTSETRSPKP